jgi:hypothetical protein
VLNVTLKQAKVKFAEKPILSAKDRGTRKALKSIGALVRTVARRSMKKRKKASPPGKPPRVVEGQLKRFLFFVVEGTKSVVIGPAKLKETGTPSFLEFGGVKNVNAGKRGRKTARALKIEARPYMGPANESSADKYADFFKNAFK